MKSELIFTPFCLTQLNFNSENYINSVIDVNYIYLKILNNKSLANITLKNNTIINNQLINKINLLRRKYFKNIFELHLRCSEIPYSLVYNA